MSIPRYGLNGGHYYSNISNPVKVDMQFAVTPTNGLGVTSLKSNGWVRNVFMHTSTTPASNNGALNPNPANGYALIQFNNNFNKYLGGFQFASAPVIGSNLTSTTTGLAYIITAVGTTTAAQWAAAGLPIGVSAAVGVSFIAIATGALGGNGTVKVPGQSGISSAEVVGDPNLSIANSNISANGGAYVLVQFLGASFAGSALATHTHDLIVIGGQAASTTNDIAAYAGPILGKEAATNATFLGSASATNGGVVAASAGTPAGSVAFAPAAPVAGTIVSMSMIFDASSVTIDGL